MDLTFIHVRKPQEVFEKGSKGTGRRRGLPAPLDPMLPFKPLKGPFPGGTEVPRVAQQSSGTRLEGPTRRSQTRASRPCPRPVTPHRGRFTPVPEDSGMHKDHPPPTSARLGDPLLSLPTPASLSQSPVVPKPPAPLVFRPLPAKSVFLPLGPQPAPPRRRRPLPRSASSAAAPAPAPPLSSPLRNCSAPFRSPARPLTRVEPMSIITSSKAAVSSA